MWWESGCAESHYNYPMKAAQVKPDGLEDGEKPPPTQTARSHTATMQKKKKKNNQQVSFVFVFCFTDFYRYVLNPVKTK